jgi:alkylhydroperoxidase family enzyme
VSPSTSPRIEPARPPFPPEVQGPIDRLMPPGVPPLALFTTLARDPRLFSRFMGGGLLDRGQLTLRQRELAILRVTARCGSEYEWGVHATFFGPRAGLGPDDLASLVHGGADDPRWDAAERALLRLCDALLAACDVDDPLWQALRSHFSEEAVLELLLLAGYYRTVSTLTAALRLPLEPFAARFPAAPGIATAPPAEPAEDRAAAR